MIAFLSLAIAIGGGAIVLHKFRRDMKYEVRDKSIQIRMQRLKSFLHQI